VREGTRLSGPGSGISSRPCRRAWAGRQRGNPGEQACWACVQLIQFGDHIAEVRGLAVFLVFLAQVVDDLPVFVGQLEAFRRGDDRDDFVAEIGFQQEVFFAGFELFAVQHVTHDYFSF
jgi:hypothetical protein